MKIEDGGQGVRISTIYTIIQIGGKHTVFIVAILGLKQNDLILEAVFGNKSEMKLRGNAWWQLKRPNRATMFIFISSDL